MRQARGDGSKWKPAKKLNRLLRGCHEGWGLNELGTPGRIRVEDALDMMKAETKVRAFISPSREMAMPSLE